MRPVRTSPFGVPSATAVGGVPLEWVGQNEHAHATALSNSTSSGASGASSLSVRRGAAPVSSPALPSSNLVGIGAAGKSDVLRSPFQRRNQFQGGSAPVSSSASLAAEPHNQGVGMMDGSFSTEFSSLPKDSIADYHQRMGAVAHPPLAPPNSQEQSASATVSPSSFLNDRLMGAMVTSVASNVTGMSGSDLAQLRPWVPETLSVLRRYFAVSHGYVREKLTFLLFPCLHYFIRFRRRVSTEGSAPQTARSGGLSVDLDESPEQKMRVSSRFDLYVPTMAFITNVLLVGLTRGTLDDFQPELLTSTASFAGILLFLEVIAAKAGFYLLSGGGAVGVPVLDLLALSGYKFVSLVCILTSGLVLRGNSDAPYWVAFAYFSFCASFFMLKSLKYADPLNSVATEWGVRQSRPLSVRYLIWALSAAQVPLCWLMTPSWRKLAD